MKQDSTTKAGVTFSRDDLGRLMFHKKTLRDLESAYPGDDEYSAEQLVRLLGVEHALYTLRCKPEEGERWRGVLLRLCEGLKTSGVIWMAALSAVRRGDAAEMRKANEMANREASGSGHIALCVALTDPDPEKAIHRAYDDLRKFYPDARIAHELIEACRDNERVLR